LQDNYFSQVEVFVRKNIDVNHPKLIQHCIDFNTIESYKDLIKGDVVFCCLGTTIKTAGSQDAFKKVDYFYPTEFAKIAKQNNVSTFCLQSSLGADSKSANFYLKVKGETEQTIAQLHFNSFATFRPSMLLGNRTEFRFGEQIGKIVMQTLSFGFIGKLKRYKAIHVNKVSIAMITYAKSDKKGMKLLKMKKCYN